MYGHLLDPTVQTYKRTAHKISLHRLKCQWNPKGICTFKNCSMEGTGLIERVQELTDLELALLLSLVAGEHCIIQTEEEALDPLEEELELV